MKGENYLNSQEKIVEVFSSEGPALLGEYCTGCGCQLEPPPYWQTMGVSWHVGSGGEPVP